jgi:acyl-CoA thioesterase FadM
MFDRYEVSDMELILNLDLLANNTCFGCGLENPAGLRIEVFHDPERDGALRARFTPTDELTGFPGITHGGAIYSALDCLSTWVASLLGPNREAAWVLRSATTVYHKPALVGKPLTLVAWIKDQSGSHDPLTVHAEARRADGTLCVQVEFKVVPLSVERLTEIAGIERLPENWQAFLSGAA